MSLCVYYLMYTQCIDVFKKGVWPGFADIDDPELKVLAEALPSIVLQSKAPATIKKYSGAFVRWKKWTTSKVCLEAFPAKPVQVALYLSFLISKSKTSASVEEAVNALSWVHRIAVVEDSTNHRLVKQIVAGAKRILAHRVTKKEPITTEILLKLVEEAINEKPELPAVRTITICLLGYDGFLRFDKIASLKESDVTIYNDHMEVL